MSDGKQVGATKADVEKVRDLFGLAHDLIAQAQFPGHVSAKVVETMQFLAYQYNDFKGRAEAMERAEQAAGKTTVLSDVPAIPVIHGSPSEGRAAEAQA